MWNMGLLGGAWRAGSDYELISTSLISSTGIAQVDFASIEQIYKHLQVRITMRDNTSANENPLKMSFNNNISTIYASHRLFGTGALVVSDNSLSQDTAIVGGSPAATSTANAFSGVIVDILDYTSTTKNKTVRTLSGFSTASAPRIYLNSSLWPNTSAVTSVKFWTGGIAVGSRFSLYGIRG